MSSYYRCTEDRFLADVSKLKMEIIRDEGSSRHLQFKEPGSSTYRFDLITWPGNLCITGDCGTYVFSRIEDMFYFFCQTEPGKKPSKGPLKINPHYWAEKLLSQDMHGHTEYSEKIFKECVKNSFEQYFYDWDYEWKDECWAAIDSKVLPKGETEEQAYAATSEFDFKEFNFDFGGWSLRDYTFRYIWNLYAIVWGIRQYKEVMAA